MRLAAILIGLALALGSAGWWLWTERGPRDDVVREATASEELAARVGLLEDEVRLLRDELGRLGATLEALVGGGADDDALAPPPAGSTFGGFEQSMLLADRRQINQGLSLIPSATLAEVFGAASATLGTECGEPTNPRLIAALETRDMGPFRTRMVRPALESLERILERVKLDEPGLHEVLRSYGALCVRLVRGSADAVSRHAYGLAIDLSIGGMIDAMGDGETQFGLILLSEYFYEEGWYWGASFGREDSMHFEVSAELFQRWLDEGRL